MRAISICVLLAASALSTAHAQEVSDDTDRFTGAREIKYQSPPAFGGPQVSSYINLKGDGGKSFYSIVSVYTSSRAGGWQYLRCKTMHWLVDGQPFQMPEPVYQGSVLTGGVLEHFVLNMSQDQMRALAQAATVEFKICNDEFKLSPTDHNGLRQVIESYGSPVG